MIVGRAKRAGNAVQLTTTWSVAESPRAALVMHLFSAVMLLIAVVATPLAASETDTGADPFLLHAGALDAEARGETSLAIDGFSRACGMGLAPSCTMAGLARLERADGADALMEAAQALAAGCLAGSDFACMRMGVALGRASAQATGEEGFSAIALFQMGEECRVRPNDGACHDAGALLRAEERGGADMNAIHAYAARACEREARRGCLPVSPPAASAIEPLDRASAHCLAARADGCVTLLDQLLHPTNAKAVALAQTTLDKACDDHVGIACANLGLYFSHGPIAARDEAMARHFMRAGCDGAVAQACFAFAVMHEKSVGGPVDRKRAIRLVIHACDLGWAGACETLAIIAEAEGAATAGGQDPAALRSRACRLGGDSCPAGL
ncbi:sel1 repeat family protein [Sphingopyxis flava]|uniref:Uncharacterized protein n=1 Tax=Sphingopyxis flava TaxID=1507287 RepID=A0A1T5FDS4_9SPHN|nr:sel1 repeat family protein [Sphingopyxis flava]SKB94324.1 hypothetical protein SAMN06295937_103317 [Sphingopyxis flava]